MKHKRGKIIQLPVEHKKKIENYIIIKRMSNASLNFPKRIQEEENMYENYL